MASPDYTELPRVKNVVFENMVRAYSQDDSFALFVVIFKNNIIGCIINVVGGVMLAVPTVSNIIFNGFASSDVFVTLYDNGMQISDILRTTLPHSIELIGFWMSGAIGLTICQNMILLMMNKAEIGMKAWFKLLKNSFVVFIIILIAAFIEAYISVRMIS